MPLREQILNANDVVRQPLPIPEWGSEGKPLDVYVGSLSGAERNEFETFLSDAPEPGRRTIEIICKVVALALRDENGARIFTAADEVELPKKNLDVLRRIYDAAVVLNKMGLTTVEAEQGKSAGVHGGSSSSDSPNTSVSPAA